MDSADGVTTHAIWGPTNGLPCKETIEDWQRLNFMSKSRTVKDTKRILVEVSNYTGCPAAQGGTLPLAALLYSEILVLKNGSLTGIERDSIHEGCR
jgi:hypothetical protein